MRHGLGFLISFLSGEAIRGESKLCTTVCRDDEQSVTVCACMVCTVCHKSLLFAFVISDASHARIVFCVHRCFKSPVLKLLKASSLLNSFLLGVAYCVALAR